MSVNTKAESHYQRALEFRKSFEETAVLEEISKAVAIDAKPEYYMQKAWACLCLKQVEEAAQSLKMVRKLMRQNPSDRVDEKELAALQKECNLQERRMGRRQEMDGKKEDLYREALAHKNADRPSEAKWTIEKAIKIERKPKYSLVLAWACLQQKWLEDAATNLTGVSPIDEGVDATEYHELKAFLSDLQQDQKEEAKLIEGALANRDAIALLGAICKSRNIGKQNFILLSERLTTGGRAEVGQSKLGGQPDFPAGEKWPLAENKTPLSFLCQLNLDDLDHAFEWNLPKNGLLYFFYDAKEQPWGNDPADKGGWKVIYSASESNLKPIPAPKNLDEEFVFAETALSFEVEQTLPDRSDPCFYDANVSVETYSCYVDALEEWYGAMPWNRLLGQPQVIQNPMQLECQLAFHGFDPSKEQKGKKYQKLAADADNWILLLQLDSDDEIGMMWGDGGRLYFWIRRDDLALQKFENVWVVLQCY